MFQNLNNFLINGITQQLQGGHGLILMKIVSNKTLATILWSMVFKMQTDAHQLLIQRSQTKFWKFLELLGKSPEP